MGSIRKGFGSPFLAFAPSPLLLLPLPLAGEGWGEGNRSNRYENARSWERCLKIALTLTLSRKRERGKHLLSRIEVPREAAHRAPIARGRAER